MTELLKTGSSQGTVIVEQTPTGILVTIKTMAKKRMFGRDKVVSVENNIGAMFFRTIVLHMQGGEKIVLRNVSHAGATELQRLLS